MSVEDWHNLPVSLANSAMVVWDNSENHLLYLMNGEPNKNMILATRTGAQGTDTATIYHQPETLTEAYLKSGRYVRVR